jgi:hypothetical protein
MRAWLAASITIQVAFSARAADVALVVRPVDDTVAVTAARVEAALTRALEREERFVPIDIEKVVVGRALARADREIENARSDIARGIGALYELRAAQAGELLRDGVTALRKYPARLHEDDVRALVDGVAHLAAIQLLEGNERRGEELLAEALAIAPDLEPDKRVYNPPMRRVFAREQKRLATRTGSISASSAPAGAMVWIDGVPRGVTPLTVDGLHEGAHVVRVTSDGRRTWGQLVYVVAKASVNVHAELAALGEIERRIEQAFVAADTNTDAPAAAAALGRALECGEVMLARVRQVKGDRVTVDAALYRVGDELRLARASRDLQLARLDQEAQAWVGTLADDAGTGEIAGRLLEPSRPLRGDTPDVTRTRPPPPAEPVDWLAWGLTGGGAALAVAGVTMAVWGDSVLGDSTSLGEDKESAAAVGWTGVVFTLAGAGLSAWGGWMLWDDPE